MKGYNGVLLRINLTNREITKERLDEDFIRQYIGGQGFGAKILFSEVPARTDSFAPENKVIFATGPYEGTNIPGSARTTIVSKSPLTGYLGDTDCGGFWGRNLKMAGYDCLVIEGMSEEPVFINITNDDVTIEDAQEIWGESVLEADRYLKEKNQQGSALVIGKAGENLVRYACIVSDLKYVAGRSGIGAVFGSKNLKGIVVSGNQEIEIADKEKLNELRKGFVHDLVNDASCATLTRFGTWNGTAGVNKNGVLPTKNYQSSTFANTEKIDGETMEDIIQISQSTCYACPVACRNNVRLKEGDQEPSPYGGPQYEAVAALGSLLLIDNPYAIARLNMLCNHLGMDVISAGATISFLLECIEKGIVKTSEVGLELSWGDEEGVTRLLNLIADKEGIGETLAEGSKRAAEAIGNGAEDYAIHVKGMEVAMHDPRGKKGQGLSYVTSHKGADHMESMHDEAFMRENALPELGFTEAMDRKSLKGKARLVKMMQDYWGTMADCLVICKFFMIPPRPMSPERVINSLNYVTGWDMDLDEYMQAGERIFNLCRMYNIREGLDPKREDKLPKRFSEPLTEGGSKGECITADELRQELEDYYELRGWKEGIPTAETLKRLDLDYAKGGL